MPITPEKSITNTVPCEENADGDYIAPETASPLVIVNCKETCGCSETDPLGKHGKPSSFSVGPEPAYIRKITLHTLNP